MSAQPGSGQSATGKAATGFTAAELAQRIGGTVAHGDAGVRITGINSLADARSHEVTFIVSSKYAPQWQGSKAGAVIVGKGVEKVIRPGKPVIAVSNVDLAVIRVLELFSVADELPAIEVHASASIDGSAELGNKVRIGPHVWVGPRARIGDGVVLHSGVRIYADVVIGPGSVLHANVVVRERCEIGRGVILHQGVSIGADGFNYRPDDRGAGLVKVPHVGNVILEDGVEIGANSCVDRGKFGATIIGAGSKIDNLCQIGHNCRIGRCCLIAGCTGISGSVTIGDGVQMGGQSGITDHVKIGSGASIGAKSLVISDVPAGENWVGYPAGPGRSVLRQWAAVRKLPDLLRQLGLRGNASQPGEGEAGEG